MEQIDNTVSESAAARPRGGKLTPYEIADFCAQLSMILKSGIPLAEGLGIMLEDTGGGQRGALLSAICGRVELREPLCDALESTGAFPAYVVRMVEIGERAGRLDEVMDSLCAYYEREEAISRSLKSAVTYPLVMIAMMALVVGVLVVKVLPVFNEVFRQLGSELTGLPLSIMNAGAAVGRYSAVIVGVLAALLLVFLALRLTSGGRALLIRMGAAFPLTGKLSAKIASGRFASAMSLMLSSGLDVDDSLDMASRLIENPRLRERAEICKSLVAGGSPFSEAIAQTGIFSGVYARMVSVGFKTGSADTVMSKLADRYEEEIDARISNILSILEPTLVAILAIIVGMILLSVMLPLMGVMSSIG